MELAFSCSLHQATQISRSFVKRSISSNQSTQGICEFVITQGSRTDHWDLHFSPCFIYHYVLGSCQVRESMIFTSVLYLDSLLSNAAFTLGVRDSRVESRNTILAI
jgi:hypothetical protein